MKTIYKNIVLAALALGAAACTQEEDFSSSYLNDPDAVRLTAQVGDNDVTGGFTRSNPLGTTEDDQAKFNSGDKISVNDVVYTLQEDGTTWEPKTDKYLKWETDKMNFTAYYPVTDGTDAQTFTVPTSYADLAAVANADYMTYSGTQDKGGDNSVFLTMERKMARIAITPDLNEQFKTGYSVTAIKVHANTTGYANGATVTGDIAVTAYKHTDNKFYALLAPTTADGNTTFLTITVSDGTTTQELEVKGIPATEAGNSYSYSLTVGKTIATVKSVSVSDWTGGTIPGGEAEEVAPPYVSFKAENKQTFLLKLPNEVEPLEYSVNGGAWQTLGTDWVTFGGENGDLRLRGKSPQGTAIDNQEKFAIIKFGSVENVACTGDLRTLVDYNDYKNANTSDARFCYLFSGCANLTTAPELPATDLADYCYCNMFDGCTSLEVAPALPATTLANYCYKNMFARCSALTTAPTLPATTLADKCYNNMFACCSALTTAPALPATTLANDCYSNMFDGCTKLTTAPELPATTLANGCYSDMFNGCTNLEDAPVLPAETLVHQCYWYMFYGCKRLNSVTMLATSIDASDASIYEYLVGWLKNTKSSGTLTVANETMKTWFEEETNAASYNPNNWTVTVKTEQE